MEAPKALLTLQRKVIQLMNSAKRALEEKEMLNCRCRRAPLTLRKQTSILSQLTDKGE